jgi:hypothetical protein
VVTQVICGYSPCSNKKEGLRDGASTAPTAFDQQVKCPHVPQGRCLRRLAATDEAMEGGRQEPGVCLHANENIYRAALGWQLTDLHGLGMTEVVGDFTGRRLGATFFRGCEPIDAIWATRDLDVAHACIMPVGYRAGDHHLFCGRLLYCLYDWHMSAQDCPASFRQIKY